MINPQRIVSVTDYDYRQLDLRNYEKVTQLLFSLVSGTTHDNKILFRGVGYDFLVDRLFQEKDEPRDNVIANRLFYFGEKAQHFRNDNVDKKWLKHISDTEAKTANKIFDRLNNLKTSTNENVMAFVKNNYSFFEFFLDKKNKPQFATMFENVGVEARDYFWAILHTAGNIGTRGQSISVSTSRCIKQAMSFRDPKNKNQYVIYSVDRTDYHRRAQLLREISQYNVPTIHASSSIYKAQKEETLKAGLFPHDIVALYCVHSKELIFNPHIFSEPNRNRNIVKQPLDICQIGFDEKLKELTSYKSWFYTYDRIHYWEDYV
jgi:hypothetical protein